jgi:hypothetical protein
VLVKLTPSRARPAGCQSLFHMEQLCKWRKASSSNNLPGAASRGGRMWIPSAPIGTLGLIIFLEITWTDNAWVRPRKAVRYYGTGVGDTAHQGTTSGTSVSKEFSAQGWWCR